MADSNKVSAPGRSPLLENPLEVDRLQRKYKLVRPLVVHALVARGPSRTDVEAYLDLLAANLN